jgi:hypothetical protein
MFDFWKSELTEEETEQLLDKAADEILKRRLEVPAVLVLESHRPLSNVGAHAALAFAPFMVPFLGFDFVNSYSQLISKPANVERLLVKLEGARPKAVGEEAKNVVS